MKKFAILILSITLSLNLHPYFTKNTYGTYSSSILKINPDPACSAMAEACGCDGESPSAMDINPATLINIKKLSLSASKTIYFEGISMDSFFFAKNLGKNTGSFGFGIKKLDWGSIEKTDEFAYSVGSYSPYEMVIEAGFASYLTGITKKKTQRIVFGGTGKLIVNKIDNTASTLSSDIGFIFPYLFEDKLILSLSLQNIIGNMKLDKEAFPIPKTLRIASTVILSKNFKINTDIVAPQDTIAFLSSGFEWAYKITKRNYIYLRAGITTKNLGEMSGYSPLSFGFGIKYWQFYFDYSYSDMGYIGNVNRFSLSVRY